MEYYREQKRGNLIILWDEAEGIGIRFELHPDKNTPLQGLFDCVTKSKL